jgi:hypothetical protein
MGIVSILLYKPKEGKEEELKKLIKSHVPLLRGLGLITFSQTYIARSVNGTYVEIFEWASPDSVEKAAKHPDIQALREKFMNVCDYQTLSSLEESNEEFPRFNSVNL